MNPACPTNAGQAICEALGIPADQVQRVTIDVDAESAVVAYVKMYVTEQQIRKVADEIALAKIAGENVTSRMVTDAHVQMSGVTTRVSAAKYTWRSEYDDYAFELGFQTKEELDAWIANWDTRKR